MRVVEKGLSIITWNKGHVTDVVKVLLRKEDHDCKLVTNQALLFKGRNYGSCNKIVKVVWQRSEGSFLQHREVMANTFLRN